MRRDLTSTRHQAGSWATAMAVALALAGVPPAQGQPQSPTSDAAAAWRAPVACARELPTQALDLPQALARALCNNPRTQQSWAQWQAKAAELQLQRSQAWPTVNATAGAGSARQRLREAGDSTVNKAGVGYAALDLSWVLLDFGQQRAGQQAAQLTALAAAAAHDDAVMAVALATAEAFFALAEAQAVVQVLNNEARFADDLLAQHGQRSKPGPGSSAAAKPESGKGKAGVRSNASRSILGNTGPSVRGTRSLPRVGHGDASVVASSKADDLDAEIQRLQLRTDQSRAALERRLARGTLLQARGVLAALLGLPMQQELQVLVDESGPEAGLNETAVEPLLEETLRDHPSLRAARARLGAAGADLDLAQRSAAPRVTLQHAQRAGRDVLRSYSREAAVGVQLEVPLFAGFARKHREALARAQLDAARAELRSTEQQVALQTWSAYQSLQTQAVATRQATSYKNDAQALLAAEMASYKADNSALTDLLDAHATVSEATLAHLSSLTAWRQARVQLAAALGRLHQTSIGAAGMTR